MSREGLSERHIEKKIACAPPPLIPLTQGPMRPHWLQRLVNSIEDESIWNKHFLEQPMIGNLDISNIKRMTDELFGFFIFEFIFIFIFV